MKKYLFVLVATMLALVGCTDQQFLEDGLANNVPPGQFGHWERISASTEMA